MITLWILSTFSFNLFFIIREKLMLVTHGPKELTRHYLKFKVLWEKARRGENNILESFLPNSCIHANIIVVNLRFINYNHGDWWCHLNTFMTFWGHYSISLILLSMQFQTPQAVATMSKLLLSTLLLCMAFGYIIFSRDLRGI